MQRSALRYLSAFLACGVIAAHAATLKVGSGPGCTHSTIQAAIDSAAADPDTPDFIRVARSIAYDDVALDIHDQHLILEGGYASCDSATPSGARTTLNGDGDHSVVRIHGHGDVVLSGLVLTGGHQPRAATGYGGGLQITDGPHLVSLTSMTVTNNDAGRGGGISVRNTHSGNPNDVQLVLGDDVVVLNNHAGFTPPGAVSLVQGGGVYCNESSLRMLGGGFTTIASNEASHDGGGIGAEECDVTIAPHGSGEFNGVVLNYAGRDGGGLLVSGPSGAGTRLYPTNADRPVNVSANIAEREGGGIKVVSNAKVRGWDLIVADNRSYDEGGAIAVSGESLTTTEITLRGTLVDAPAGATECAPAHRCNRISGNSAKNADDELQQAAAVRVYAAGGAVFESARVTLLGTRVEGNTGLNLVRLRQGTGAAIVRLYGVAIVGNTLANEVILNPDPARLQLHATTIAGNAIGGADVIRSNSFDMHIARSILWQPDQRVLNVNGIDPGRVTHLLASDLAGVPPTALNFIADPRFVDSVNGDVHLQTTSPAIDRSPVGTDDDTGPDPEADDAARAIDIMSVVDAFGPQDLGAYELQRPPPIDMIFADAFERVP